MYQHSWSHHSSVRLRFNGGCRRPGYGRREDPRHDRGNGLFRCDASGVQDPGERGASDIVAHLLDTAGERIATTETFAHACEELYIFSGVSPGNYTVEVVPSEGYGFTVPGTASTVDAANGTTIVIDLTEEAITTTDLVVRDAGLVPATL